MADFIDPSGFPNEEALFNFIIERIIKPKLREMRKELSRDHGDEHGMDSLTGVAYVFGGQSGIDPAVIRVIQKRIEEGLDLEYVLREMTDLAIRKMRESRYNDLTIRYVELAPREADQPNLSAQELEDMFQRDSFADGTKDFRSPEGPRDREG